MSEPLPEQGAAPAGTSSFDALFHAGFTPVVRALVTLGADRATAEDLAQEAFCVTCWRWNEIRGYYDPLSWVAKTAFNMWNQHCRTSIRRRDRLAQSGPSQIGQEKDDLATVEKRLDIQRCMRRLPEGQREVLVMHHILDRPVREIARILAITEGTVKSQLHDGRRALHKLLSDGDDDADRKGGQSEPERQ